MALFALLFASTHASAVFGAEEVVISRVEGEPGFTVDVSRAVTYAWFELDQPRRLVLDLYGVTQAPSVPTLDLSNTPVVRIRAGFQPDSERLRIVFDLRVPTDTAVATLAPPAQGTTRMRVDVPAKSRRAIARRPGVRVPALSAEPGPPHAGAPQPAASEPGAAETVSVDGEPQAPRRSPAVDESPAQEAPPVWRSWDYAFSGTWEQEWAVETDGGDAQKFEALVEPRLDVDFGGASLTGIARIRLDSVGDLGPDQSSPPNYSDANGPLANSEHAELSLRELYLDFYLGRSIWRVGKQQVVWGEADGLKVLDVVNPQSFREFIMDDFDDSRIPLWMVNAEFPVGLEGSLQLLWIPDTSYHELAELGTSYQFTSPLLVPQPVEGVDFRLERPDKPSGISDGDAGARFSLFLGGWDMSFNYLYHHLDAPVFYQSLELGDAGPLVTVSPEYERSHLGGMTLSTVFADFTLRAELVYNSDNYFTSTDPGNRGVTESAEVGSVIGLDWQLGGIDAFVSGQWFQSHLLDHERETVRSETTHTFTLLLQKNFANATWTLDAIGLYSADDQDSQLQLKLRHLLFGNTEIWVGADIFSGDRDGVFGQFSERDRALLGVEIGF